MCLFYENFEYLGCVAFVTLKILGFRLRITPSESRMA